jgi:hypothetical protein
MMGALQNIVLFDRPVQVGDSFYIHDSLPFEGRELKAEVREEGVYLYETIDGETVSIYVSYAELAALMYQLSQRRTIS